MANMLWIDGVLTPMRAAKLKIWFPDPSRMVLDAKTEQLRAVQPRDVIYGLEMDVDEHSGEDTAAAPAIQSIPVWQALGGRHPDLAELGQLCLDGVGTDEDWDAWFGNDAPHLVRNRLVFEGWTGLGLRTRWEAYSHDGLKFLDWLGPDGQRIPGGTLRYEGEVEFAGLVTTVQRPDDADTFIRAVWGEASFATLRRIEEHRFETSVNLRYVPTGPPTVR